MLTRVDFPRFSRRESPSRYGWHFGQSVLVYGCSPLEIFSIKSIRRKVMKEFNPLILKKPYRTPQLVVYGNLAEITRSITGTVMERVISARYPYTKIGRAHV